MKFKAFHKMSYGMYLVASEYNGKKAGYIANTVFQVTSEPPQIAISCHKDNESLEVIQQAEAFSVSVLKQDVNMKLIGDFGFMSASDLDKFAEVNVQQAKTGSPIVLDGAVAWFDCEVREMVDLGTHWLIVGEVVESDVLSGDDPLTYKYYREKYKMLSPKNSPTYIEQDKLENEQDPPQREVTEKEVQTEGSSDDHFVCQICGFTYDPEEGDPSMGVPAGTPFEELPEDYKCPICNAGKDYFKKA
ncbi:flavin reductase [Sunxiuqinia sp. A32]|uniref:flavin reductase n=1 Tax=Sunxiuqinia sp. A32 TaxID=3461496 RepID=UPI0040455977